MWVRNNHITSLGIYLVLPADLACRDCRCATSFYRGCHRRGWCGGLLLAQRGGVATPGYSPLSVDQAAAARRRGGLAEVIRMTRCRVDFFIDSFRPLGLIEYNRTFHDCISRRWGWDRGRSGFILEIGGRRFSCRIDDLFHRLP